MVAKNITLKSGFIPNNVETTGGGFSPCLFSGDSCEKSLTLTKQIKIVKKAPERGQLETISERSGPLGSMATSALILLHSKGNIISTKITGRHKIY